MGRSGKREHDLFLEDLRRISDYLHSTNYTGLKDTHLHVVEPNENLIRNQFYKQEETFILV